MSIDNQSDGTDPYEVDTLEPAGIAANITAALRYPAESDDVVRTVAIGGFLSLFSFLIVPLFVLGGYVIRVLNRTADGDDAPPAFDEWGELTLTGLKAFVIGVGYLLVPAVVGGSIILVGVLGIGISGDGSIAGLGTLGVVLGGLVWFALSLFVAYLLPAALANFAETQSIGSGFDVGALKPVWLSRTYAVGWVTMVLVVLIGGLVTAVLNVVPILGTIAAAFVGFYFGVAAYAVIGRTWAAVPVVRRHDRDTLDERAEI